MTPRIITDARRSVEHIHAPQIEFPAGKRPLGGRAVIPVTREEPTLLHWGSEPEAAGPLSFRVISGTDHRFAHRLRVKNAGSGELYGTLNVFFSSPGQMFEFALTAEQAAEVVASGLSLQLEDGPPLWIVAKDAGVSEALCPHLYAGSGRPPLEHCLSLLCSEASLQPCDWMAVCVLDVLRDWSGKGREDAKQELRRQLDHYFNPDSGQREDIYGQPTDDHAGGPESAGPFAVLALEEPQHPALRFALEGFDFHRHSERDVVGKEQLVTESAYNVAYPMMAMALHSGHPELKERSLKQLRALRDLLTTDGDVFLRYRYETGERTFQNWSRGVAWYFLGLVRTLALLPEKERPRDLVAEAERMAEWVARHQLPNGLWACFLNEGNVPPDSSGCAGIAAALAVGVREGMVDASWLPSAVRAYEGLMNRMTPDGWLRGTSQSNKKESHGMDIQRHPFRVTAPWGMGLFGQLASALEDLQALPATEAAPYTQEVYKRVAGKELVLQVFRPESQPTVPAPCILWIHGGGWVKGHPDKFIPMGEHFRSLGFCCVSMQYRLIDDGFTVFDAVEDAHDAMRYLKTHAEDLHVDPDRIAVCGGSAGGHLAAGLALFPRRPGDELDSVVRPAALVLLNPVLDTSENGYGHDQLGEAWRQLSPLHNLTAPFPPAYIGHGTADQTVPIQGVEAFVKAVRDQGGDVDFHVHEGVGHGYYWQEPDYTETLESMGRFFSQRGWGEGLSSRVVG
ncbi:MAG: glycoside hydrolase family 88 protein [Kiritimatiellia bacterium]